MTRKTIRQQLIEDMRKLGYEPIATCSGTYSYRKGSNCYRAIQNIADRINADRNIKNYQIEDLLIKDWRKGERIVMRTAARRRYRSEGHEIVFFWDRRVSAPPFAGFLNL